MVDDYQLYKGKVDFHDAAWTYAANTFADWVKKGYIAKNSVGLKAEDMRAPPSSTGKYPMMVSGSWWYGRFESEIKDFHWGTFLLPGQQAERRLGRQPVGGAEEAAEQGARLRLHRHHACSPKIQNLLGNTGGVPVAADPSAITDPKTKELIENFNTLSERRRPGLLPGLAGPRLLRRAASPGSRS